FIAGERPVTVYASALNVHRSDVADHDNVCVVNEFDGGSVGTLAYNTVGDKSASKERIEVDSGRVVAMPDHFHRPDIAQTRPRTTTESRNQDKGQSRHIEETLTAMRTRGTAPIAFDQLVTGMQVVFAANESLATRNPVAIEPYRLEVGSTT